MKNNNTEIIKKVKKIEIKTKRLVNEVFGGEYQSIFKGQGIEFSEVRPYQYGDDSRLIDWKVSARHNTPFVKIFSETRELNILIMFDASHSTYFSAAGNKREIAGEIASVLTFSALKNNDKTGLILFSNRVEKFIPLKKGKKHSLNIVTQVLTFDAKNPKTDIGKAIREVNHYLKRKTIIFLISDFLTESFQHELNILARKHDVIGIMITDDFEEHIIEKGIIPIKDIETGETFFINANKYKLYYKENIKTRKEKIEEIFKNSGSDLIMIKSSEDYYPILYKFFKMREKRFR
jgi:uncharacterized protein (DUF58 family)